MNEKSTKSCHLALKMNVFYYAAYSIVILVFIVCTDSFWEVPCSFVIRVQPRIAGFSLQSVSSSSRKFRSIFCFFWCKNVFFRWSCRFFFTFVCFWCRRHRRRRVGCLTTSPRNEQNHFSRLNSFPSDFKASVSHIIKKPPPFSDKVVCDNCCIYWFLKINDLKNNSCVTRLC